MLVVEVAPQWAGDTPSHVYVNVLDPGTLRLLVRMAKAMQSLKPGLPLYGMEWSVFGVVELVWTEATELDAFTSKLYSPAQEIAGDVLNNIDLQSMCIDPDGGIRFVGYWEGTGDRFHTYSVPASVLLGGDDEKCEEA